MRCFAEDDMIKENRVKTNTKEENRHTMHCFAEDDVNKEKRAHT